ncbi:MAG: DUF3352 domain-containing protein [Bacteroidota bacterium]
MKVVLRIILLLILVAVAAVAGYFLLEPEGEKRNPLEFVPADFVYLIESDRPIGDWQDLSKTEVWQHLKGTEFVADIAENANYLDSLLEANQTLVNYIKLGDLVISAHMISRQEYEFIIAVDMKGKGAIFTKLKQPMVTLFEELGYQVTTDKYFQIDIFELYDAAYKEYMYISVVENVLLFSYDKKLLRRAIEQSEQPAITEDVGFASVRAKTSRSELYNLFINYGTLNNMLAAYSSETPEFLQDLDETMRYSGFDLTLKDDEVIMNGFALQNDSTPSYLRVFKDVGQGKIRAAEVLPQRTAMYTSVGFDDFSDFYTRFTGYMEDSDPEGYKDLAKNQKRLEKLLKIEFERDFFSWMDEEIVSAIVPSNEAETQFTYYAMLHFDDVDDAQERMNYVLERIDKRTPVKFQAIDYRGFEIKYMELNGFFKLFFKKMFSEIEKPHFTYIDDYVVFANDTTALITLIEDYLNQQTLANDEAYKDYIDSFDGSSNIFTYLRNEHLYGYLYKTLDVETRRDLRKNKDLLQSFPQIGLQLYPSGGMYKMYLNAEFQKKEEES